MRTGGCLKKLLRGDCPVERKGSGCAQPRYQRAGNAHAWQLQEKRFSKFPDRITARDT